MEYWMGESLAILFFKPSLSFLGYEAIVYQANPQRCDKISDPRVRQDLQLGLPRILQPGGRFLERRVRIAGMAHELGRSVRETPHELLDALTCQLPGLRNPAKIIGAGNTCMRCLFTGIARQQLQPARLHA